MSFEITRVFTPNYKDTGLKDWRFNEDLQAISQSLEVSTIRGLAEFAKKKLELSNHIKNTLNMTMFHIFLIYI